jgi:hypothetical protein
LVSKVSSFRSDQTMSLRKTGYAVLPARIKTLIVRRTKVDS